MHVWHDSILGNDIAVNLVKYCMKMMSDDNDFKPTKPVKWRKKVVRQEQAIENIVPAPRSFPKGIQVGSSAGSYSRGASVATGATGEGSRTLPGSYIAR